MSELAETLTIVAPCKPEVKELLVDIALQQGDGARAVELLRPLISASPLNPEYHGKIGVAHALAGDLGSARNHLLQAIQLKPDYLHALLDLCRVARSLGFYDESIQAGTAALAIEPDGPVLHSNLALSYELYGLYEKAREHYECAAMLCPDDPDVQQKAGVACSHAGAKEQARQYFEKAIALNPRLAPAYRGLAVINKYATTKHQNFARMQALLDIEYETLVHDQEQQTRRLLEFVGLPWDDRCLKFFESEHSVHTASHSQVRKPMYTSSIGRWKHYAKHLEPLHRGLRWLESNSD